MHIHEYQAKAILAEHNVTVPSSRLALSPESAGRAYAELPADRAVVKAQIHAGGRGKAGGIIPVSSRSEAEQAAAKLLGATLVTPQTGPLGRRVDKVLVEEALDLKAEFYLGMTLDRKLGCPVVIASARGGVEIEELARTEPDAVVRETGNPFTGLETFQARKVFVALGLPHDLMKPFTAVALGLGSAFVGLDASLIEINPLGLAADGRLIAADAKMAFDDNAVNRHPQLADLRDPEQEDPREVEAKRYDLSYVGLDGTVGCMVNGAGLAMATMDLIELHGGKAANFLDVGGSATVEKVAAALRIICGDTSVRSILVNIFGRIVRCDLIAEGVLEAVQQTELKVPLVVRLAGNRADQGRRMLAESGLRIAPAEKLEDAAAKAVELSAS